MVFGSFCREFYVREYFVFYLLGLFLWISIGGFLVSRVYSGISNRQRYGFSYILMVYFKSLVSLRSLFSYLFTRFYVFLIDFSESFAKVLFIGLLISEVTYYILKLLIGSVYINFYGFFVMITVFCAFVDMDSKDRLFIGLNGFVKGLLTMLYFMFAVGLVDAITPGLNQTPSVLASNSVVLLVLIFLFQSTVEVMNQTVFKKGVKFPSYIDNGFRLLIIIFHFIIPYILIVLLCLCL